MSTPEIDSQLRATVARLKQAELRYRNRLGRTLGAWFIAGVVVGLGTWFIQKPMDRDEIMFGGVSALGLATFFFGGMLSRMLFRKPDTKCPQCGYDWKLSGEGRNDMLTWRCCPGCGLDMSDDNFVLLVGCRDHSAPAPTNLERTLTLSTSSGDEVVNPTDRQIHEALSALGVGRDGVGFAILSRSEMTYLQVSGEKTLGFAMEYQEGDVKNHFRAARKDFSLEKVVQALSEYRDGTIDWSVYGDWHRIAW